MSACGYVCLKHEASTAATSGAPAPPTGPLLRVRRGGRVGGSGGESYSFLDVHIGVTSDSQERKRFCVSTESASVCYSRS